MLIMLSISVVSCLYLIKLYAAEAKTNPWVRYITPVVLFISGYCTLSVL